MPYWNYRSIEQDNGHWTVREILYDDQGTPKGYYPKGVAVFGGDRDEMLEDLDRMMRATFAPAMTSDELLDLMALESRPSRGVEWKDAP